MNGKLRYTIFTVIVLFFWSLFVSRVDGGLWLRLTFNDYVPEGSYVTVPNDGGSTTDYYGRAHGVGFVTLGDGVTSSFPGDILSYVEIRTDSTTTLPSSLAASGMSVAYWVKFSESSAGHLSLLTTGTDSPTTPDSIQQELKYPASGSPPYTTRRIYDYGYSSSSTYNIDTWYHIVYSYIPSGSDYVTLFYVNGSQIGFSVRGPLVTDDKESLLGITNNSGYSGQFKGEIDQMDIFDHAVNGTEVSSLYAEGPVEVSNRVVGPTFDPPGATYMQIEDVTITSATAGATIYYTTDGSTPTTGSAVYTGPVSADKDMLIQAIAVKSGMTDSAIGFADYKIYYYSDNFLANRPRLWRKDNRIVWLDVEQYNDDQVFYNTCKAEFVAEGTSQQFDLPVRGDKQPLVRSLQITSEGTVVNPKVLTDSATCVDSDTPATVAADIISADMSNRQKAEAVFNYLSEIIYWSHAPIEYVPGQVGYGCVPGAMVNSSGYATCAHLAPLMVPYWQAAGFTGGNARKRRMGPNCSLIFHSLSEVYYDGDWHLYDLTQLCFYLENDDVTVASVEEIVIDNNLVVRMRNDTSYDPTWVPPEEHALKYGCEFDGGTTGLPGTAYGGWTYPPIRTMAMTMGPGQSFTRTKSSEGFYWQAWDFTTPYTIATENGRRKTNYDEYIANGFVSYPLAPGETSFDGLVSTVSGLTLDGGATPPCRTTTLGQDGYFILPINTPIAITDIRVDADFRRVSPSDTITVSYYSDDTQSYTTLFTVSGTGESVVVSQEVPILRGMHEVLVKFTFNSSTGSPCGLNSATVRARVQNNPRVIPPLEMGDNVISYTSDSQSDDVSVSYIYVEQEELPIAVGWPNLQPGKVDAVFFCDKKVAQTSIPVTIANKGGTAVTITPTVSHIPAGWTMSFTPSSVVLDPNEEESLVLNCTPPGGIAEGIVGAELNFLSATYGDAHKRMLLGVMDSVVAVQAEDGVLSGMSAVDEDGVSGTCVGPDSGMAGVGTTTYQVNVPYSDDYYLVVRLNMLKTNYYDEDLLLFDVDGNLRYFNRYSANNLHRRKQDHYVDRWEWFLNTDVITLSAGIRQVTLTGLKDDVYLDSFALVSSKDVADLVLMNQLYCPEGFDESIAQEIVAYDFDRSGDVGVEDLLVMVNGWVDKDIPYQETSGLLVMEAEHYSSKEEGGRWGPTAFASWDEFSGENSMGDGFVQALPNECLVVDDAIETVSPCLTYQVNFSTTGTYYLWLKGKGYDGSCDSAHYGLNGSVPVGSQGGQIAVGSEFGWRSLDINGTRPTIIVSVPGEATIDIWMREDDTKLDRILLTTDEFYDPSISEPLENSYLQMADRRADLNFDGVINLGDFSMFSGKWLDFSN